MTVSGSSDNRQHADIDRPDGRSTRNDALPTLDDSTDEPHPGGTKYAQTLNTAGVLPYSNDAVEWHHCGDIPEGFEIPELVPRLKIHGFRKAPPPTSTDQDPDEKP